jgi:hypothetical protein
MDRLYAVKRPFAATTAWVSSTSRIFRPGETLWWDAEGFSDLFKVDGFKWHPEDAFQFAQSIEPFESSPSSKLHGTYPSQS